MSNKHPLRITAPLYFLTFLTSRDTRKSCFYFHFINNFLSFNYSGISTSSLFLFRLVTSSYSYLPALAQFVYVRHVFMSVFFLLPRKNFGVGQLTTRRRNILPKVLLLQCRVKY